MINPENPYSPPQSEVTFVEPDRPIVLASKGRRFGTFIIDNVLSTLLGGCLGFLIAYLFGDAGVKVIESIPEFVLGFFLMSFYYIFFEGIWARTPGKFLFGTVVVSDAGTRPTLKQIVGRTLCRFIPFEAFSCLGEIGWHDSIPETKVVLARAR